MTLASKTRTLVVVPCGSSKIWKRFRGAGPTPAKDAYTGAPFKVNREYAETFGDRWVILSAKYGFIDPGFVIPEDYNVTFNDPATHPVSLLQLRKQVEAELGGFDRVTVLGGKTYAEVARKVFDYMGVQVRTPTAGLPIGFAVGKVKKAVREGRPFDS